jgi:type I restriction enzyme R subunit
VTNQPGESQFEETTLERLKRLGYRTQYGGDIERPLHTVVLPGPLRDHLRRRYPHLPPEAVEQAVQAVSAPEGVNLDRRNMAFQRMLRQGLILRYEQDGEERFEHVYFADFDHPELNDFLVVNQLTIQGAAAGGVDPGNTRRPDLIVYVNGLPLVVFELKNPWDEYADAAGAYNQIGHYTVDVPQLFNFNAFCVVSDGVTTLHGVHSAGFEWFAPWKSVDGVQVEPETTGSMKTLIEGLFPKDRLLDYVRSFIVHEVVSDKITKKAARYHQYFAVRFAVEQALRAMSPAGDRRVGVVWHTQGAGKSLSMVFFVGILRRWPGLNPSFVIEVDRNDLDDQLHDSFVAARELVGSVQQADSVEALRDLLATEGGEIICSTIEKFRLREDETRHPVLSTRRNILVIADEAHRTQYGLLEGFAGYLRQALPNASFLGFTGTPIDKADANTVQIFGDYIHIYDMQQAREDQAVVGIFYEARHIPLKLADQEIDAHLEEITERQELEIEATQLEQAKAKWATVEKAAGTQERLALLARDLLDHFNRRQEALAGKAMAVCMSRRNCVALYDALTALPGCPEVKIVMTGDLARDPKTWSEAGHITTKGQREAIKARFIDPDDRLKLVIVRDMWLTGFDAPCANTLYIDKPMKGHNLMQAIARVNRIFRDKPGGLIVDYIGIGDDLKEATRKYTSGGGRGELTEDLTEQALSYFFIQLQASQSNLPAGRPYDRWRDLSKIDLEDLCNLCYGTLAADETLKEDFLDDERRLSKAFSLVSHLPEVRPHFDEVAFYQMIRKGLRKLTPRARRSADDLEHAVQDLLDESITAQPAVDIFAVAGLENPDISILDEKFLAGFGGRPSQDLQIRLLAKLMQDDLYQRRRQNLARYRSFKEMLDEAITRYNNGAIQAADVVRVMVEMRQRQLADERRKMELGLNDEELAFYDVILHGAAQGLPTEDEWIAELVRDVVAAVRSNLKVDWTRAHRRDVYASVQSAVSRVLRRRRIKGEQFRFLLNRLMKQAEASYEDWPMAA